MLYNEITTTGDVWVERAKLATGAEGIVTDMPSLLSDKLFSMVDFIKGAVVPVNRDKPLAEIAVDSGNAMLILDKELTIPHGLSVPAIDVFHWIEVMSDHIEEGESHIDETDRVLSSFISDETYALSQVGGHRDYLEYEARLIAAYGTLAPMLSGDDDTATVSELVDKLADVEEIIEITASKAYNYDLRKMQAYVKNISDKAGIIQDTLADRMSKATLEDISGRLAVVANIIKVMAQVEAVKHEFHNLAKELAEAVAK